MKHITTVRRSGDLPAAILRLYAVQESHFGRLGLQKDTRCLHGKDVVCIALEGDIRAEVDSLR
jgi:hypothetical protein